MPEAGTEFLINLTTAQRRLGWSDRRLHRYIEKFSPTVIGGRTYVDSRKVDEYIANLPDLTGLVTAAQAARLLGVGHTHFVSRHLVPVALVADGRGGQASTYYKLEDVLRVDRERKAEQRAIDRRRAKRENRRRDRIPRSSEETSFHYAPEGEKYRELIEPSQSVPSSAGMAPTIVGELAGTPPKQTIHTSAAKTARMQEAREAELARAIAILDRGRPEDSE